jgi:DNA-binding response OmpR family regulator
VAALKKILIVDDDPDYVSGIKPILEKAHYEVDAVYTPRDGLKALEARPYDLVLLDIMMGRGAEGVMVASKMCKDARLKEIPVLVITGIRETVAFLFPLGRANPCVVAADALLEKPVEPKVLLEKVAALLKTAEEKKPQTA